VTTEVEDAVALVIVIAAARLEIRIQAAGRPATATPAVLHATGADVPVLDHMIVAALRLDDAAAVLDPAVRTA
jgi:hypothetical protein